MSKAFHMELSYQGTLDSTQVPGMFSVERSQICCVFMLRVVKGRGLIFQVFTETPNLTLTLTPWRLTNM